MEGGGVGAHTSRCATHWAAASLASLRPAVSPTTAGVSLAANAVADHLLGDRLRSPAGGALGVLLVCVGVTLCTLAQQPQDAQQAAQ